MAEGTDVFIKVSGEEAPAASAAPPPLFQACNRGIVVAAGYAAAMVIGLLKVVVSRHDAIGPTLGLFAAVGVVAGAIAGFSNTDAREDARRDLARNALDALMVFVWCANALLLVNLVVPLAPTRLLFKGVGCLAVGAMAGGTIGEPLLIYLARFTVKGRRPFLFVNRVTRGIANPTTRLITRVVVQTIVAGVIGVLAFFTAVVLIALLAIALGLWILAALLSDGNRRAPNHTGGPTVTIDKHGNRIERQQRQRVFGETYEVSVDVGGNVIAEHHERQAMFGGSYGVTIVDGNVVAEHHERQAMFGDAYVATTDVGGNVVSETHHQQEFGEPVVELAHKKGR